jgi:glycosyltransferase involved in cell wall biosynthesis
MRFEGRQARFIFYASQFRPSKNVITLLRAYDYLLKRRYLGHKLVLTGNPSAAPEIAQFIRDHNLQNDILCLNRLSDRELAACYKLADLAVNPSLSEGGCPFTFTEALSVATPVVMARIGVALEVITEPELREIMFFDPYDWKDIADRIEWALINRGVLLERQLPAYERLSKRTWSNVVDEHISLFEEISTISGTRAAEVDHGCASWGNADYAARVHRRPKRDNRARSTQ